MRIVSLLPSATEVLYALGAEEEIIGVSHDSDYPPEVRLKPVVSASTIDDSLTSAEIDSRVGQTYHAGGSIYHLDPRFLERERPDLIVAQDMCQVCAVTSAEARRAAELARSGARILSLEPATLTDALNDIRTLGEATGRARAARELVAAVRAGLTAVSDRLTGARPVRVLCLGWLEPLISEGHWLPELLRLAGGQDSLAQPGEHSRRLEWQEVLALDPEAIILMPCSFSLARTLSEVQVLGRHPGWDALAAVRSGQVYAVDSGSFSHPGPRLVAGLEILARCLHPDRYPGPIPTGAAARLTVGRRFDGSAFVPVA
ncbi:MAG: cobalamin-binding protein [Chloroflexota bacterium]